MKAVDRGIPQDVCPHRDSGADTQRSPRECSQLEPPRPYDPDPPGPTTPPTGHTDHPSTKNDHQVRLQWKISLANMPWTRRICSPATRKHQDRLRWETVIAQSPWTSRLCGPVSREKQVQGVGDSPQHLSQFFPMVQVFSLRREIHQHQAHSILPPVSFPFSERRVNPQLDRSSDVDHVGGHFPMVQVFFLRREIPQQHGHSVPPPF